MEDGWLIWSILPNYVSFDGYFYDNDFPNMSNVVWAGSDLTVDLSSPIYFIPRESRELPRARICVSLHVDTLKWCRGSWVGRRQGSSCAPRVYFLLYCSICPNSNLFYTPLYQLYQGISLLNIANDPFWSKISMLNVKISLANIIMDSQIAIMSKNGGLCVDYSGKW